MPLTPEQRAAAAADIVANTQQLVDEVNAPDFTFEAFQIANGAKELLDEVATGKVTGEEEIWSHTDLWDFQANVDGARVGYEVLADVVEAEDPDLAATLATRFERARRAARGAGLARHRLHLLRQAHGRAGQAARRCGRRALRAPLPAHRDGDGRLTRRGVPVSAPTDPHDEPTAPTSGLSRRAVLGLGGGLAAVGVAAGFGLGRATAPEPLRRARRPPPARTRSRATHQAGIVTPAQDRLYLAAFDLTTTSRDELVELLRRWTTIAARLTQGLSAGPYGPASGPYDAPPDDTGEAADLRPAGLTITFGFGRSMFVGTPSPDGTPGEDRFGLADRLPGGLVDLPHFAADDLDPARSDGDLVVQACADDPQIAVHAIRNLSRAAFGSATIRWTQLGYGRTSSTSTAQRTPRNLFGFKDGTANVKAEETKALEEHVWVPASAADADDTDSAWLTGGSLPRRAPDPDAHRDVGPHVAARAGEPHRPHQGRGRPAVRAAPSSPSPTSPPRARAARRSSRSTRTSGWRTPTSTTASGCCAAATTSPTATTRSGRLDAGLFFLAFVRDPRTHFIPMQTSLSSNDALMEYLTHTGSGLFAVPPGIPDGVAGHRRRRHAGDHGRQPVRRAAAVRLTAGVICRA